MCEQENDKGSRIPCPSNFHKVKVEDVGFAGEVVGRQVRDVGLELGAVGRGARERREEGGQRTEG